ncbi:MAG: alpha/beta hydrolase [bacterium]|nr:alpha/beta hydrolase [bacterium]
MNKKVLIIHGWDGSPEEGWFPWLKTKLESKGYDVTVPPMPAPQAPEINAWINKLENTATDVDENTFFVGHSIGCQTILRFLEKLPEGTKVGGVVCVAGWTQLNPEATPDNESAAIAKPWIDKPMDWKKIKSHTNNFVAIFSDNDPLVPISEKDVFEKRLGAKIMVLQNKGHFSGDDGVSELPEVLSQFP